MKMQSSHPTESANSGKTIWVFTPSRTDPKDLEFILVQRQNLLRDAVERVRESALTDHKHHLLFVGPRGCGKTHLVTLIVSRLAEDETLTDRLRIAWLNEDETCTTLLEFLLKIHAALEKRYSAEYREDMLSAAYDLKPDAALEFVSKHLLSALGSRTLLVVTENLDAIFEGLGDSGQKQLRSFIQENPRLSIVATAQRLVEDLSNRNSPFFGFFQTEHLKPLTVEQATELLQNIARLQDKGRVVEFLATSRGRSRVRAIHHLSGGNHRIYIVLSQFITRDSVDALLEPFMKMVDELTPYYQERIRWLPPMQRKIVEYLCTCEGTVPVKEIAKRLFATPQTISSQLQDLREKGYVAANQRGRESLYEISEPLMRICVEVKDNQRLQPLRLLVDFLRVWYDDQELKHRLGKVEPASAACGYLESAIRRNSAEGNLRKQILLGNFQLSLPEKLPSAIRDGMVQELKNAPEGLLLAMQSMSEKKPAEAILCLDETIAEETTPANKVNLLLFRASLHSILEDRTKEIDDYSAVIALPGAPAEQVAKALLNRGITHGQAGDPKRAVDDYTAMIGLPGAPAEQIARALILRGITHGQMDAPQRAIDDFTVVIGLPDAPVAEIAEALVYRGVAHGQAGDLQRAISDFTEVIGLPSAPVEQVAEALVDRGVAHGQAGDSQCAINDFTTVIGLPNATVEQTAWGLFHRGIAYGDAGDPQREINDYTTLIGLPDAPDELVARALIYRGITHGKMGDTQREIDDYTTVIGLPDAPVQEIAEALIYRGITHGQMGDTQREIDDYNAVIGLPNAPVEQFAESLVYRGVAHGQAGDPQRAIDDFTAVIGLPSAPVEQIAKALSNRGVAHGQAGNPQRAIDDFTTVIGLPSAQIEQIAGALLNRGIAHNQAGDTQHAIDDYTEVISLTGAPVEPVAWALYSRGVTHFQKNRKPESQADFEALIRLSGAPVEKVVDAYLAISELHFSEGRWSEGFLALEAGLECGLKAQPSYCGKAADLIGVVFSAGLNSEGRRGKVAELLRLYQKHQALPVLGEAVIQHIGSIYRSGEPFPSSDNLEGWKSAWEQGAESVPDFRLSIRLLCTSISFLKAGGKDRTILLDLASAERSIVEQAFGLLERPS
jgi:tetratricopeptide (TPR) repeat protein